MMKTNVIFIQITPLSASLMGEKDLNSISGLDLPSHLASSFRMVINRQGQNK